MYSKISEKVLSLSTKNATFSMMNYKDDFELNSCGFRCSEFSDRKEINIVTIGCEKSLGCGLEINQRYSTIFSRNIEQTHGKSTNDWNLSIPAKSNDYISRMTLIAQRNLNPDIVLISFAPINRREYWTSDGKCIDYLPENYLGIMKRLGKTDAEAYRKIHLMRNDYEDLVNFHKNFYFINNTLKNTRWLFSMPYGTEGLVSASNFIGNFNFLDILGEWNQKASHWILPGPNTHQKMAYIFTLHYNRKHPPA